MARPHLRRRSNEGEALAVPRKPRGSGEEPQTTRPALASFNGSTAQLAATKKGKQVKKTAFDIFVDLGKRKRTSVEGRGGTGVPRSKPAHDVLSSSDEGSDGSQSDQESSGGENEQSDEYYLKHASTSELRRMDRERLVELARTVAGQMDKGLESHSKTALADTIVNRRAGSSTSVKRPVHERTISLPQIGDLSLADHSPPRQRRARVTRSISDNTPQTGAKSIAFRQRISDGSLALSEDRRRVAFEEQIIEERSDSELDGNEPKARRWREATPARWREPTPIAHRTRRRSSKNEVPALPAPPKRSEESKVGPKPEVIDVDASDEEKGEFRSPRRLRNGKVVNVFDVEESDSDDTPIEEVDELESSDSGSEDELSEEALGRMRRSDLLKLCDERHIGQDGTKKELVDAILKWQKHRGDDDYVPPSSPSSVSSGGSGFAGRKTPRFETKSEALAAIEPIPSDLSPAPRLLTSEAFTIDSTRPETPCPGSGGEDEDVETLDLDSLGLTDKAIAPEKLKRGDKIGAGGFKDVYIGKYRNYKVAIADLRDGLTESDVKELLLLRDLQHANIVRFIGVCVPDDPRTGGAPACTLVTELCPNGDMYDYLRSGVEAPTQRVLFKMMLDIVSGLEYLHTRTPRIIHRDMKSSNVLITAKGVAKIKYIPPAVSIEHVFEVLHSDFGLARVKTSTRSVIKSLVGTVNWQAPELWAPKPKYNEKVDVYATGLVFWEMLQFHMPIKRYPFEGANDHAIYHDVGKMGMRPPTATMGRRWGSDILVLVDKMWAQQAADRPSMTEVRVELEKMITAL